MDITGLVCRKDYSEIQKFFSEDKNCIIEALGSYGFLLKNPEQVFQQCPPNTNELYVIKFYFSNNNCTESECSKIQSKIQEARTLFNDNLEFTTLVNTDTYNKFELTDTHKGSVDICFDVFLRGITLQSLLRYDLLQQVLNDNFISRVLEFLNFLKNKGYVHSDISKDNIVFIDNVVRFIDFDFLSKADNLHSSQFLLMGKKNHVPGNTQLIIKDPFYKDRFAAGVMLEELAELIKDHNVKQTFLSTSLVLKKPEYEGGRATVTKLLLSAAGVFVMVASALIPKAKL
jgi:serine/threonine protein kinase